MTSVERHALKSYFVRQNNPERSRRIIPRFPRDEIALQFQNETKQRTEPTLSRLPDLKGVGTNSNKKTPFEETRGVFLFLF